MAGYVPGPLDADDYIELLPVQWRTINSYWIRINHRTYDAKALNPLLEDLLALTSSEYGFIGEVLYDAFQQLLRPATPTKSRLRRDANEIN